MTSVSPAQRDVQVLPVGADSWILQSRSWTRLKFEIEYALQRGTTSNTFLIQGEKTALLTPPGETFTALFLVELERLIPLARIDYLIVGHINPNRFKTLLELLKLAPHLTIVCSNPGAAALRTLIEAEEAALPELQVIRSQETLDLGRGHELHLIPTPTPRWPDGLCVYDTATAILYTDKFFGAHVCGEPLFEVSGTAVDTDRRYYYYTLMAAQARQVETVLERIETWPAQVYAPVHGPLLRQSRDILKHYRAWNREQISQSLSVAVIYASAYGNTATLSQAIARGITKAGVAVEAINCEFASAEEIRSTLEHTSGFIIGSPTIGGHVPTPVQTALGIVLSTASKSQLAGVFGSFGWSGEAIDLLEGKLQDAGYSFGFEPIRVKFKPTAATLQQCEEAGTDFAQTLIKRSKRANPPTRQVDTPVEQAVGRLVGSLSVVTARHEDVASAMLASWVSQATFNPPGLTVAVAKDRAIESLMYPGDTFVLNLLEEGKHLPLMKHFLKPFGPGEDRFAGVETLDAQNGSPVLRDALAFLECRVANRMDCGDHWLVYCTVEAGDVQDPAGKTAVHFRTTGTHY